MYYQYIVRPQQHMQPNEQINKPVKSTKKLWKSENKLPNKNKSRLKIDEKYFVFIN